MTAPLTGLTAAEVAERQARGRINRQASESNRTYGDILRENLFTFINGVFAFISVILLFLGRPGDVAAIIVVVFLNAIISILQEIRAKRQLDEISLLTRPRVKVLRDRQEAIIDPAEVVEGDILLLEPGIKSLPMALSLVMDRSKWMSPCSQGSRISSPSKRAIACTPGAFVCAVPLPMSPNRWGKPVPPIN